ncbi:MAG: MBL fold metallo-hydrolase [Oligoflexia bacterium]|nr:MBL fold metallo-hydrolase [Oligoflexia bacterium]
MKKNTLSLLFSILLFSIILSQSFALEITDSTSHYNGPQLEFDGRHFHSPPEYPGIDSLYLWNGINIFFRTLSRYTDDFFSNTEEKEQWFKPATVAQSSDDAKITLIGHATFLIQLSGINILTDPIFGDLFPVYYTRMLEPGIAFDQLPSKIDVVIISHNHPDHMEFSSFKNMMNRDNPPLMLVPKGVKKWFDKYDYKKVVEFIWGEQQTIDVPGVEQKVHITFLPANHISGRGAFDIGKTAWGSWLIENNEKKIYFAGDTNYSPHFKEIAKNVKSIDAALMPIAPNEPADLVDKAGHMGSASAVEAFIDLDAHLFIPMHWGIFRFGSEKFIEPINRLYEAWNLNQDRLFEKKLVVLAVGESMFL